MTAITQPLSAHGEHSNAARWSGRILSGFVVAFLLLDGAMKLLALPIVTETMADLGWPATAEMARLLGALTVASALLYAVPRTSLFGAILLTAYLGGAVATHVRVGSPLLTHTLFGVYLGVAAWAGLYLRNTKLRELLAN
jgi:uncharacterized membrane protein YphA (DoxX/SURF4 family)